MRRYGRLNVSSAIRHPEQDEDPLTDITNITVHEAEPRMVNTGLLYPDGSPIIAYEATGPIGFIHHKED